MYVCNYCGRYLKNEYEVCPGCGGNSFKTKAYLGETIIEKPPEGGYKINIDNYQKEVKRPNVLIIIGTILIIGSFLFNLPALFAGIVMFLLFASPVLFVGILLLAVGLSNKKKFQKDIARINKLSKHGLLVKGMPYKVIDTGEFVLNKHYKCIEVNFKNSAGVEIPLYSETKYDIEEKMATNNTVDLLIDKDDYSNYYIDYEIF